MELELRLKIERVALNKRKPVIPQFRVLGQPVISDVRSNPQSQHGWRYLLDAIKSTKTAKSCQNGLKHSKIPFHRSQAKKVMKGHRRSVTSNDLVWPLHMASHIWCERGHWTRILQLFCSKQSSWGLSSQEHLLSRTKLTYMMLRKPLLRSVTLRDLNSEDPASTVCGV